MITIRRARLVDTPLLIKLESEFFRDIREIVLKENPKLKPYMQQRRGRDRIITKWIGKWLRAKNTVVFIAEADSSPAGFAVVWIDTNPPPFLPRRFGFIGYMFVRRRFRGQRISSLMMREALAWFAKRQIKHVALSVIADNKPARAIWGKWGFYGFNVFMWKVN